MILNFLNLFLILGLLLAIVYFLKRFLKNKKYGSVNYSEHIKVIDDGISLGIGQKVSIIKVGEELFLMTHGQNGVAFQKLDNSIVDQEKKFEDQLGNNEHSQSFKELGALIKNEI